MLIGLATTTFGTETKNEDVKSPPGEDVILVSVESINTMPVFAVTITTNPIIDLESVEIGFAYHNTATEFKAHKKEVATPGDRELRRPETYSFYNLKLYKSPIPNPRHCPITRLGSNSPVDLNSTSLGVWLKT